jgi:hypothetical protein
MSPQRPRLVTTYYIRKRIVAEVSFEGAEGFGAGESQEHRRQKPILVDDLNPLLRLLRPH